MHGRGPPLAHERAAVCGNSPKVLTLVLVTTCIAQDRKCSCTGKKKSTKEKRELRKAKKKDPAAVASTAAARKPTPEELAAAGARLGPRAQVHLLHSCLGLEGRVCKWSSDTCKRDRGECCKWQCAWCSPWDVCMVNPLISGVCALQAEAEERAAVEQATTAQEQASTAENSSSGQSDNDGQPGNDLKVPCYFSGHSASQPCTYGQPSHLLAPAWQEPDVSSLGPCAACMPATPFITASLWRWLPGQTWCLCDRLKAAKMQRRLQKSWQRRM
jgi:hypothetical protein